MSDKILRYSAEAIIIYLLLRYFPNKENRFTTYQALIATFILLILSIIIELLISAYLIKHNNHNNDNHDDNHNDTKQETFLEKFDESIKCSNCDQKSNDSTNINNDDSINQSQDSLVSRYTANDQLFRTRYGIDGMLYDEDDDKTNNLPVASDYEPSYSYISSESS